MCRQRLAQQLLLLLQLAHLQGRLLPKMSCQRSGSKRTHTQRHTKGGFEFGKASLLLLNGLDQQRTNNDRYHKERLHRHSRQTVNWKIDPKLADDSVFSNHKERALDSFGVAADVRDLGMMAGDTSNAGHSELLWMYGT